MMNFGRLSNLSCSVPDPSQVMTLFGNSSRRVVALGLLAHAIAFPTAVSAGSLAADIHSFIDANGFPVVANFPETVSPLLSRVALEAIDLPPTATSAAINYRFNF